VNFHNNHIPKHWSFRFLKWFCPDHLYEEIEGDLIQKFQRDLGASRATTLSGGTTEQVDVVKAYIENQHEHHSKKTFQDEYRPFLKKYKVEYDERYVWD
jgi:hypothetical protein